MSRRLPILAYHSLDESGSPVSIAPALFRRQMSLLHERGWRTLGLRELLAGHLRGEWPSRTFAITFDDGFRSVAEHGLPALAEHGFTATVFVVTDWVGRTNDWPGQPAWVPRQQLLDWPALRELAAAGLEIGAHTLSHPHLSALAAAAAASEILDSKRAAEDVMGRPVGAFAYPYGDASPALERVVGAAFEAGFGTDLGFATAASRKTLLERVDVYYLRHARLFAGIDGYWLDTYLRARRWLREARARLGR